MKSVQVSSIILCFERGDTIKICRLLPRKTVTFSFQYTGVGAQTNVSSTSSSEHPLGFEIVSRSG